jgi:hypothetical protein
MRMGSVLTFDTGEEVASQSLQDFAKFFSDGCQVGQRSDVSEG